MSLAMWVTENRDFLISIFILLGPPTAALISAPIVMHKKGYSDNEINIFMASFVMIVPLWMFAVFIVFLWVLV